MKKLLLGAAMLGVTMGAGSAQAAAQDRPGGRMAALFPDPNGDGATSKDEMLAASDARFAGLDTNKDGKLSTAEIAAVGRGGRMLTRADSDGDGQVTQAEARAAAVTRFDRLDANRDGRVDQAERDAMRQRMGPMPGGEPKKD
ncbi:MAG TPA: EF-hand domain-containing protein [Sphingomonas sp.]|nr:EF-hand domain-containing protein [Sphingomonas sp.]